jgi:hyperosmotically inducible periplasmic protein
MKRRIVTLALALGFSATVATAGNYPAENTGKNVRDKAGDTLTAIDQSNDPKDLEITQEVRKAIVADDALSTNAKNVKVITVGGVVTLRGPVNSVEEKTTVANKAKVVAGVSRVDNQLEIASN